MRINYLTGIQMILARIMNLIKNLEIILGEILLFQIIFLTMNKKILEMDLLQLLKNKNQMMRINYKLFKIKILFLKKVLSKT